MTTGTQQVERSLVTITAVIASDMVYLENDDLAHFDPITVAAGVAAMLLGAFLEGVRDAAKDGGRRVGKALGQRLRNVFIPGEVFPGTPEVVRAVGETTLFDVQRYGDIAQALLLKSLVENGLPLAKAEATARVVRSEADRLATGASE